MKTSIDKNVTPVKRPRSAIEMILYGSLLGIVFLAYFVPVDVLRKYPQFVPFVDFMASWNTQIRRVGEISGPRSQVNMFIYSMTWCLIWIPVICFLWIYLTKLKQLGWRLDSDHLGFKHLMGFITVPGIWFAYTLSGEKAPIAGAAGRMILLSSITSPAWSVGGVALVIFGSIGCVILTIAFFPKIYRHFKG